MSDPLAELTYMVRHSPNCPKRFEVRLSGLALLIEWQRIGRGWPAEIRDGDDIGYGDTYEEAAAAALAARNKRLENAPWRKPKSP